MSQYAVMPLVDYQDACNAIRDITGGVDNIVSGELKPEIQRVYEAGEKEENDRFWDAVQNYGNRINSQLMFNYWNCEYIRPKHKVVPTAVNSRVSTFSENNNLKKVEKEYFDFSQVPRGTYASQSWYYTWSNCRGLEEIEDIGIKNIFSLDNTFRACQSLHTIACIYPDKDTKFNQSFIGCNSLVHIRIGDGCVIGQDINFQWSPLSVESAKSVINHLFDFVNVGDPEEYTHKVIFSEETWALLDADTEYDNLRGLPWREYLGFIGWLEG